MKGDTAAAAVVVAVVRAEADGDGAVEAEDVIRTQRPPR